MKNKKYYSLWVLTLALLATFISCEEDGDVRDGIRDVNFKATAKNRNITEGGTITFIDSSTNVTSRLWTFTEGSIPTSDQATVDVDYLTGQSLNAEGVLPGYLTSLSVTHDDGTVEEGEFLVRVYNKVNVDFEAEDTEVIIGASTTFTPVVENLRSLFEEARAEDGLEWTFEGGTPATSNAENPTVTYNTLGTYRVTLTAHRESPLSEATKTVEGFITVTEPVPLVPDAAVELEDETISISFNGDFEPVTGQEAFIEVKVNGVNFAVESLSVDATDQGFLNIKLQDAIYQDDDITVSLLPGSNIVAMDTRTPETFTDLPVESFKEQFLISEGQFEEALDFDWIKLPQNATIDGITEVLLVDPPTGEPTGVVPSGKVINLALNRNGGATQGNANAQTATAEVNLVAGQNYVIKFKRYMTANSPNILFRFNNQGGANQLSFNAMAGDPNLVDRWLESEFKFTALATHAGKFNIVSAWAAYADFYIDDIVIESDEARP
ncbi:PKD domain-containing protein [Maribacter spongiicola]|uniref:PKD domain-containing protein n=1 Tax=Maribacter spongiicola TaxID=1206753 RepID=UPI003F9D5235